MFSKTINCFLIVLLCITGGALGVTFDTSEFKYLPLKELETMLDQSRTISGLLKDHITLEKSANVAVRKAMRKLLKDDFDEILAEQSHGSGAVYWRGVLERMIATLDGETA